MLEAKVFLMVGKAYIDSIWIREDEVCSPNTWKCALTELSTRLVDTEP